MIYLHVCLCLSPRVFCLFALVEFRLRRGPNPCKKVREDFLEEMTLDINLKAWISQVKKRKWRGYSGQKGQCTQCSQTRAQTKARMLEGVVLETAKILEWLEYTAGVAWGTKNHKRLVRWARLAPEKLLTTTNYHRHPALWFWSGSNE